MRKKRVVKKKNYLRCLSSFLILSETWRVVWQFNITNPYGWFRDFPKKILSIVWSSATRTKKKSNYWLRAFPTHSLHHNQNLQFKDTNIHNTTKMNFKFSSFVVLSLVLLSFSNCASLFTYCAGNECDYSTGSLGIGSYFHFMHDQSFNLNQHFLTIFFLNPTKRTDGFSSMCGKLSIMLHGIWCERECFDIIISYNSTIRRWKYDPKINGKNNICQ